MTARAKLIRSPADFPPRGKRVIATLGMFDGLHRGHRELTRAVREARKTPDAATLLITFYPHPDEVLRGLPSGGRLSNWRRFSELLAIEGIEWLYLYRFTKEFSRTRYQDFLARELLEKLNVQHLVIGPDAHIGFKREGTPEKIVEFFTQAGRSAEIVPFVNQGEERVSSGKIRELIAAGNVAKASSFLGRPYEIQGKVVRGDGRGRTIGVPTANLHCPRQIIPGKGVYSCRAEVQGREFKAVVNIGVRPTFGGGAEKIEAHLLDYQGSEFYGARMTLHFVDKVRDEKRFESIAALTAQIAEDVRTARAQLDSERAG